ncbi:MAG TPA: hypothetical protein VEU74_12640 [Gemmatimonadales bacterium]|nr:hypothetical protein [Gemmatimonadales bacterium]
MPLGRYAFALSVLSVSPLLGQRPITLTGVRGLTFGTVLPGVPAVVSRSNGTSSGQFDVNGPHGSQALLTFTLPIVMTGPAAATLPLLFGGSDAGYSQTQSIASQIAFDPKQPFTITFSQQGRGSVFLGGTAQPAPTQRAGSYSATITLTVVSLP